MSREVLIKAICATVCTDTRWLVACRGDRARLLSPSEMHARASIGLSQHSLQPNRPRPWGYHSSRRFKLDARRPKNKKTGTTAGPRATANKLVNSTTGPSTACRQERCTSDNSNAGYGNGYQIRSQTASLIYTVAL